MKRILVLLAFALPFVSQAQTPPKKATFTKNGSSVDVVFNGQVIEYVNPTVTLTSDSVSATWGARINDQVFQFRSRDTILVNGVSMTGQSSPYITNLIQTTVFNVSSGGGSATTDASALTTGILDNNRLSNIPQATVLNLVSDLSAKSPNILTGYVSGAGTVAATDNVLQAIQKLNGNDQLRAPNLLTGYTSGAGTISASDNVLSAIQKLNGNIGSITSNTATYTNKRITARVTSITTSATITPTSDASDIYKVTAQAANATIAAPSGTPTDGQFLRFMITSSGGPFTLTWNAAYKVGDITLPTATVANKTQVFDFMYSTAVSGWLFTGLTSNF